MKSENYMNLEFPSRSANEAFARSAIACFAAQLDPTLDELGDIKTAVSEAVTNCIVHAYPETTAAAASRTLSRPAVPCSRPVERSAPAWALPSWRAL